MLVTSQNSFPRVLDAGKMPALPPLIPTLASSSFLTVGAWHRHALIAVHAGPVNQLENCLGLDRRQPVGEFVGPFELRFDHPLAILVDETPDLSLLDRGHPF